MMCDRCRQLPACVNAQITANGQKLTRRLCADCARALPYNPDAGLAAFLSGMAGAAVRQQTALTCEFCGMTAPKLSASGRVGCARCYDVFEPTLTPYIRQIHGSALYAGRVPNPAAPPSVRQIEALRDALRQAVERQAYEEAATLRDRIRAMEAAS